MLFTAVEVVVDGKLGLSLICIYKKWSNSELLTSETEDLRWNSAFLYSHSKFGRDLSYMQPVTNMLVTTLKNYKL